MFSSVNKKRWWYNGQHSCLPSSRSEFVSRPSQLFLFAFVSVLMQWIIMILKTCISIFVLIATFNTDKATKSTGLMYLRNYQKFCLENLIGISKRDGKINLF